MKYQGYNPKRDITGKNNPNYKNAGWHICEGCGERFHSYNKKSRFCTRKCYESTDEFRENCIKANDGHRKKPNKCKKCETEIHYSRIYCEEHNPNKKARKGKCLNCTKKVISRYDVQFCKECRSKGLHKKKVFSICIICGAEIPKYNRKFCDKCWSRELHRKRGTPRRVDENQSEIIDALRKAGCDVIDTSDVGGGFPDIVVGRGGELGKGNGYTYLIEIKNPKAKGKLNKLQEEFFEWWQGQVDVAFTIDDALRIVGLLDPGSGR